MEQYHQLVRTALEDGGYKPNRTGTDTISTFSPHYHIDLDDGFPILTTKKMDGYRWDSMIHEVLWYLSGEEHIRNLRDKTSIWDAWADEAGHLDTAYGRFWRRYPIPSTESQLEGESWPDEADRWVNEEDDGRLTFDQLQYVIDSLKEKPHSRRFVINAWHPANAAVSTLPPCHYSFVLNVQGDKLNLALTQRSGDIALGIPFNIVAYSLLLTIIAQRTGFKPGTFSHTIVDAHVYCGSGSRGEWYCENLEELQSRMAEVIDRDGYKEVKNWVESEAPEEDEENEDHVPGLLTQLTRSPKPLPSLEVADKPIDELVFDDVLIKDYERDTGLKFAVAE